MPARTRYFLFGLRTGQSACGQVANARKGVSYCPSFQFDIQFYISVSNIHGTWLCVGEPATSSHRKDHMYSLRGTRPYQFLKASGKAKETTVRMETRSLLKTRRLLYEGIPD